MFQLLSTVSILAFCAAQVSANVGGATGTPVGFASGVTGGGSAARSTPTSTAQLISWLGDDVARVIVIDKEYNFIGTEGTCKNCAGCIPSSNTCGTSGQNAIASSGSTWCDDHPSTKVTYDTAGIVGITVGSDKSLIGVGDNAIIRGKGLRIISGAKNVIVQNIHFTEINPSLIWGGDAISLDNSDEVWIDHCKFSLIGRQMFVSGYEASGRVTLSFNEFDGQTSWSSSCDGRHYWTILGYGDNDLITLYGNYIHHTSGRSPKLEFNSVWHATSNYWYSNSGHAFDVSTGANALIEGNVFEDVTTPIIAESASTSGQIFVPTASTAGLCSASLGRVCQTNTVTSSGTLAGTASNFLVDMKGDTIAPAHVSSVVKAWVLKNAGVGKL